MRFSFKKIAALGASLVLTGMSMGMAAAAAYPAPFVQSGSANVAVVYGAGATVDLSAAQSIQTSLNNAYAATAGGSTTVSGESFQISRTGDEFNLGNNANSVLGVSVRASRLPTLLADGTYLDDNNDEFEYTQKVDLSSSIVLSHFRDSDLDNIPTIGANIPAGTAILNYTLEMQTKPDFDSDLETTELSFLGKTYFISSVGTNSTTLLDSATTSQLSQGETKTLTVSGVSYAVGVSAISASGVIFTVNGQATNRLAVGSTYKTSGGAFIGVKDFQQAQFAGDVSFVEFSLGSGKLTLTEGSEVELNDEPVEGLTVAAGSMNATGNKFAGFTLLWTAADDSFLTPNSKLVLPGFESLELSMTEFYKPKMEEVSVQDSGQNVDLEIPLKAGTVTLPLLYHNGTGSAIGGMGQDADNQLITSNTYYITYNRTAGHKWFVASWVGSTDAESRVFEITSVNSVNETTIKDVATGSSYTVVDQGEVAVGDVELRLDVIERTSSSNFAVNVSNLVSTSAGVMRNVYTAEGLKVYLPYQVSNTTGTVTSLNKGDIDFLVSATNTTAGANRTSWYLYADEQDKEGALAAGGQLRLTLTPRDPATADTIHVSALVVNASAGSTTGASFGTGADPTLRVGSTDEYEGYVQSDLATMVLWDKSGDEYTAALTYHGDQAYGKVYLTEAGASVISGGDLGNIIVTDSEVASVATKNLVVVGGSCVNSVAATLLGSAAPMCEDAWTTATGVGSGQFLIQSFGTSSATSGVAVLVAGYEAADTLNAATYLTTKNPDTAAGKKWVGTSATSASLQVS